MSSTLSHHPSRLQGQGLLMLWGQIDPATTDEVGLNDWWTNEHLPERLNLPGFQQAHRYHTFNSKDGTSEYLTLYDSSDVQDLASPEYLVVLENPTPRTKQYMPCFAGMNRSACKVQWSEVKPATTSIKSSPAREQIMLVVLNALRQPAELLKDLILVLDKHLSNKGPPTSFGVTCTSIAEIKDAVTKAGSASKSYENVQFTQRHGSSHDRDAGTLVALFEFCIPGATEPAMEALFDDKWEESFLRDAHKVGTKIEYWQTYKLICSMSRKELTG
ncbi:Nn.00g107870.m01.CDS01 [Neocucurbitaria sp. VM-36]